jgi:hypothetical protein
MVKVMAANKIVARYNNGRIIKGSTCNFDIGSTVFNVLTEGMEAAKNSVQVVMRDLKAIFFVNDFVGMPKYDEKKDFSNAQATMGRRVKVTFNDGEILVGATVNYDPGGVGFFMIPADPQSNNKRIFVINTSVRDVEMI